MAKVEETRKVVTPKAKIDLSAEEILSDYRIAVQSRAASVIGHRQVMTGKAKFGIFGDGKEVPQLAMAKTFQPGDIRSGYYRDQTFMLAAEMMTLEEFFGQLYADTDLKRDPASGGRQMGSHFATRILDDEGHFKDLSKLKWTSADLSPTAGQVARLLGLAYASKLYRANDALASAAKGFSNNGNEVAFGTIGNASTSEGIFFETMNAAGVLQVPLVMSVWDDEYGISVPNEFQTIKGSISEALAGFRRYGDVPGFEIFVVKAWDYVDLCDTYALAVDLCRNDHIPVLIHVTDVTQPQGHSTSGSQERYKSKERLEWESEFDCIRKMREWMLAEGIASAQTLKEIEEEDRKLVQSIQKKALEDYLHPIRKEQSEVLGLLERVASEAEGIAPIIEELREPFELNRKLVQSCLVRASLALRESESDSKSELMRYLDDYRKKNDERYNSFLFSRSDESPLLVEEKKPVYSENSETVDGRVVLVRAFDHLLKKDARIFIVGEDVGKLGDVNLVFEGLNAQYGDERVTDTGIREATILGQGIGAAMRGLRPIVDIQYLDYLLYALQVCSDDLATLQYRTRGGQKSPVIIRTKGHRLQGIWHTGSPMGMILHGCRGVHLCVPRDMTRAAGMYNTLLRSDDPAIVIEVLSGYRLKERVPDNIGTFMVPLGRPEVLREGTDVTIVTYGACCRIALEAAAVLEQMEIDVEIIDVQTLSPFDVKRSIVKSLEKTNAAIFLDEDVPGGASAFMMQEVLEVQEGWQWLDAAPKTLAASANRSAYAADGEYFTKPNREDVVEAVYEIMSERFPAKFPPNK